jgi:uncharacterized membrane protein
VSVARRAGWYLLGVFYLYAGWNHFRDPAFYLPMIPPGWPAPRELVDLSGAIEFGLGFAALAFGHVPQLRRAIAWGVIALLVAVFPANLYIAFENVPIGGRGEGLGVWNWVRLPFQALFIAWAWIYTRRENGLRGRLESRPETSRSRDARLPRSEPQASGEREVAEGTVSS